MSIMKLRDGRGFEYLDNGFQSEEAILLLHGTPGDATAWLKWLDEISEVRAIAARRISGEIVKCHYGSRESSQCECL